MGILVLTFSLVCAFVLQNNFVVAMQKNYDEEIFIEEVDGEKQKSHPPVLSYREEKARQDNFLKVIIKGDPVLETEILLMESFIELGAQVNVPWYVHNPLEIPLFLAVSRGRIGAVKVLLDHGADPKHEAYLESRHGTRKTTPLHCAAQCGYVEIIKMLLEKGAEINAKDSANLTPLLLAVNFGDIDVIECLLAHHYKTDAKDRPHRINDKELIRLERLLECSFTIRGLCKEYGCCDIQKKSYLLTDLAEKLNLPSLLRYFKDRKNETEKQIN